MAPGGARPYSPPAAATGTVTSQSAMAATTAESTCRADIDSCGVDGPEPEKKKWLSAEWTRIVTSGRPDSAACQRARSSATVAW